ncbi:Ig-like domain repeat protein [Nocardioides carbamazepini]|uniref:hypothetical protein n=1 Tax=Nocardioides carbamazepini TaxID=2854259 RepID=UPI002149DE50|nr:hypothetical protein [Nocardioides carbamazepini]MCR1786496.1 Ig-like domain repeat protein [Nocardioides carbamazepini]
MALPASLALAGSYVGWGSGTDLGQWSLPAELEDVALLEVATAESVTLALTGDGRVAAWGQNAAGLEDIPAEVASMDVVDLAVGSVNNAGVVGADGRVVVWGRSASYGDPTDVPQELTRPAAPGEPRVVQLALGYYNGFALKSDGTVVAWGNQGGDGFEIADGLTQVPNGLEATQIAAGQYFVHALTTDGTVIGWGSATNSTFPLPPATQVSGNVKAIASNGTSAGPAYALLADGSTVSWGSASGPQSLPDMAGTKAVAITAAGLPVGALALDEDGALHASAFLQIPASLAGQPIGQFGIYGSSNAAAIVTRMLRAKLPTVVGTAQVGSGLLTGTPGTFSAEPDDVTSQWLVNGQAVGTPVAGESTSGSLPLADYPAGTTIAYRSTATKAGEEPVTATSAVTTVAPAPTTGTSKTTPVVGVKVTKAPTTRKAGKATVTVQGGVAATGSVTVTATGKILKKGKKKKTKTITVTGAVANGTANVTIKKIKGAKGKWTVTASYAGDATHNAASSPPVKIKVKR